MGGGGVGGGWGCILPRHILISSFSLLFKFFTLAEGTNHGSSENHT